jgi:hypothetical protein
VRWKKITIVGVDLPSGRLFRECRIAVWAVFAGAVGGKLTEKRMWP